MRLNLLACLMVLMASIGYADDNSPMAKLTFRVTDSLGTPVTNADVGVSFYLWSEKPSGAVGKTDTNGLFTVEGLCSVDANCSFVKDGYYLTSYRHAFSSSRRNPGAVKDGKWQPWNPTIEITLKEKRNPIPMYAKTAKVSLPKRGEEFGFDMKKGELVKPHGNGEQADLLFMCNIEERGHILDFKKELFVSAVQPEEGVIVNAMDGSQFRTIYEAQENGYSPRFYQVTDRTPSNILQIVEWNGAEYLTFRSRIVRDHEGKIISSHYGKIVSMRTYGVDRKNPDGASVSFTYYFNPTPNDRNIEYDPNENLFDKMKHRGMQP